MRVLRNLTIAVMATIGLAATAQADNLKPLKGQESLRVCADAHNLPYANDKLEGFDNKIAAIIGDELGIPVEYYWFPQRIGFSRNTIKKVDNETGKFLCDLAMSIPSDSDFLATTNPYFSSIEAMVYRNESGYDMKTFADVAAQNKVTPLTIGIFDRGMATKPLLDLGLYEQIRYYQMMTGDARINAGRIISEELASGNIDVAFLWGPIAAYYADKSDVDMTVVPLNELGERHVFSFGMGVRYQDKAWKALLNQILEKRKDDIAAVMAEYHLPSLENVSPFPAKRVRKDDDD